MLAEGLLEAIRMADQAKAEGSIIHIAVTVHVLVALQGPKQLIFMHKVSENLCLFCNEKVSPGNSCQ